MIGLKFDALNETLDDCAREDTFIFYFSGHSLVRKGSLYLVLGDDKDKRSNLYSSDELINQMRGCKAGSKLLMLDCCDAGQSVYEWSPGNDDNLRVLTATDRTERSKEFDDLKAGVFTYHFHQALTNPRLRRVDDTGVVDENGTIWVNKLSGWLRQAIIAYGKKHQRNVPKSVFYGPDVQNMALVKGLTHYRHVFIPTELRNKLKSFTIVISLRLCVGIEMLAYS